MRLSREDGDPSAPARTSEFRDYSDWSGRSGQKHRCGFACRAFGSRIRRSGPALHESSRSISEYINRFGYDAYAWENVETYRVVLQERKDLCVAALSSAFMTYRQDIHPEYGRLRTGVDQSPTTFVLIPSLDYGLASRKQCVGSSLDHSPNRRQNKRQ